MSAVILDSAARLNRKDRKEHKDTFFQQKEHHWIAHLLGEAPNVSASMNSLSVIFAQLSLQTLHSVHDFPLFRPVGKVDHGSHGFHGWGTPESVPIREIRGSSFCPFGCGGAALGSLRSNCAFQGDANVPSFPPLPSRSGILGG